MDPDKSQDSSSSPKLITRGFKRPSPSTHDEHPAPRTPDSQPHKKELIPTAWQDTLQQKSAHVQRIWTSALQQIQHLTTHSGLTANQLRIQRMLIIVSIYLGIVCLIIYFVAPERIIYLSSGSVADGVYTKNFQLYAFWCAVYSQLAFSFGIGAYIAARAAWTMKSITASTHMLLVMCGLHIVVLGYLFLTDIWEFQQLPYSIYTFYWIILIGILVWIKQQLNKGTV
jgi:hypothetical protein